MSTEKGLAPEIPPEGPATPEWEAVSLSEVQRWTLERAAERLGHAQRAAQSASQALEDLQTVLGGTLRAHPETGVLYLVRPTGETTDE